MTELEQRQDSETRSEAIWWEERRKNAPNLQQVIDAVWDRLETETDSGSRTALEIQQARLSQLQRDRVELTDRSRDEHLQMVRYL